MRTHYRLGLSPVRVVLSHRLYVKLSRIWTMIVQILDKSLWTGRAMNHKTSKSASNEVHHMLCLSLLGYTKPPPICEVVQNLNNDCPDSGQKLMDRQGNEPQHSKPALNEVHFMLCLSPVVTTYQEFSSAHHSPAQLRSYTKTIPICRNANLVYQCH